jgi:hypothetical protein
MYKRIRNNTSQGLELVLKKERGGFNHVWLDVNSSVVVSEKCITDLVRRAAKRELVRILPA